MEDPAGAETVAAGDDAKFAVSGDVVSVVPGLWTPYRRALHRALGKFDPTCASLYRQAIDALGRDPLDHGALVAGAHCIRELVNSLSRLMDSDPDARRAVKDSAVDDFVAAWLAASTGQAPEGGSAEQTHSRIGGILDAGHSLVLSEQAKSARAAGRRSILAVGHHADADNPTVKRMTKAINAFERYRHPGDTTGWPTSLGRLANELEIIEAAIAGRIGKFFDVVRDLRKLLDEVNAIDEQTSSHRTPIAAEVEHALARIGDPQHRRVFYEGLTNPTWVAPLAAKGAFAPPLVIDDEQVWVSWAAGPYLVRMAAAVPKEVAKVIRAVLDGDRVRPDVIRTLLTAIEMLPPSDAAPLVKSLRRAVNELGTLEPNAGLSLAKIMERLAVGGHPKQAMAIAHRLLRPEQEVDGWRHTARAGIKTYWYHQALAYFVRAFDGHDKRLATLVVWLEEAANAEGLTTESGHDLSTIRRGRIGEHEYVHHRDRIVDDLIDAVRDVSIDELRRGREPMEVVGTLSDDGPPVLARIAKHIVAVTLSERPELKEVALTWLLDRGPVNGHGSVAEWIELSMAALPLLDDNEYAQWEQILLAGPEDTESKRQRLREHLGPDETEEAVWTAHVERWQLDLLGTVGEDLLRGDARARLDDLRATLGEPDDPAPRSSVVRRQGHVSDPALDTLAEISPTEVIAYIREHQRPEQDRWGRDVFDLGGAFEEQVSLRVAEFGPLAAEAATLRPGLFNRFLGGLRKAVDEGEAIAWSEMIAAAATLQASPEESEDQDDHPHAARSVLHLIEAGIRKSATSGFRGEHLTAATAFTAGQIHRGDLSNEASTDSEIARDPFVIAINSTVPTAVMTLGWILQFAKATDDETLPEVVSAATSAMDVLLKPDRVSSLAVAAGFGAAFGHLRYGCRQWLNDRLSTLLTADSFGDIVTLCVVRMYRYPRTYFDTLEAKLLELIERVAAGEVFDWKWDGDDSPVAKIGAELLVSVLHGDRDLDDQLVAAFLADVPPEIRALALRELGYAFGHDGELPADVQQRAQNLWDSRQAKIEENQDDPVELAVFPLWIHSGVFPASWWLPRLAALVHHADLESRQFLGERLAEAAEEEPATALEVLGTLIKETEESWARHDLVDHAPRVIACGLTSGDEAVVIAAQELTDSLGRLGYLQIEAHIAAAVALIENPSPAECQ